jgi:hypothetical protein
MKKLLMGILTIFFCLPFSKAQNIQMKKWVFNNQSIDFTVNPPIVVSGLPQFSYLSLSDGFSKRKTLAHKIKIKYFYHSNQKGAVDDFSSPFLNF